MGVLVGERLRRDMDALLGKVRESNAECDRLDAKRMEIELLSALLTKMMNEGRGGDFTVGRAKGHDADAQSLVLESASPAPSRPRLFAFGIIRRGVRRATTRGGAA